MPDDLPFIGLKRTFAFCIQGRHDGGRIGAAPGDGIAEKLKNIVIPPSDEATDGIPLLDLTKRIQT
jgi:hypothetical protein